LIHSLAYYLPQQSFSQADLSKVYSFTLRRSTQRKDKKRSKRKKRFHAKTRFHAATQRNIKKRRRKEKKKSFSKWLHSFIRGSIILERNVENSF